MADIEARIDALYALPLAEFTAARNRLAAELKAKDPEAAKRVRALAKPNNPAWVLNRLARVARRDVEDFLSVGEELRRAEDETLAGGGGRALRDAAAREREAADVLVKRAGILAREAGIGVTQALSQKLGDTLRAAVVDADAREKLVRGRLAADLRRVGFGEALSVASGRRAATAPERAAGRTTRSDRRRSEPVAALRGADARRERDAATRRERQRAKDEARRASREAERLDAKVRTAERNAQRLAVAAPKAATAAAAARERAGELRRQAREASKDAQRARRALDRLTDGV